MWAIVVKILHRLLPTSHTMWELHLGEMHWWTILWTTPSEHGGWHNWNIFGPGPSCTQQPSRAISRSNFTLLDWYVCPKKCPQKTKSLFIKRKFKEVHKGFNINYPYNNKCGKTLLSTKLQNTLVPNSLYKLMQLISIELHLYDLDRGEIYKFGQIPEETEQGIHDAM